MVDAVLENDNPLIRDTVLFCLDKFTGEVVGAATILAIKTASFEYILLLLFVVVVFAKVATGRSVGGVGTRG